jgi:hypothetical protein
MSGIAVIIWSLRGSEDSLLYSRSPIDLLRLRIPLTLLSSTKPPAFSILVPLISTFFYLTKNIFCASGKIMGLTWRTQLLYPRVRDFYGELWDVFW